MLGQGIPVLSAANGPGALPRPVELNLTDTTRGGLVAATQDVCVEGGRVGLGPTPTTSWRRLYLARVGPQRLLPIADA
jgi:hypothetical protein